MPLGPAGLSASDLLARIAGNAVPAEAAAAACLARTASRDPGVQAWAFLDPDAVLRQARTLDRAPHRGPLHGLPVGIKDVINTSDMPTQHNSPHYQGSRPGIDAACVSVLRAAGALIFGKTDTVEFAATGRKARTRNPHDLTRTPGGSSSGSAAAVADFHVPLALGTQTGGSIIRPAAYCGVFGMKPTWGLVSTEGARTFSVSLDTIGWFARAAGDLALLYDVFDPETDDRAALAPAGLRVAVCRTPAWSEAEPATRAALDSARDRLVASGADVTDLVLPPRFDDLVRVHGTIMKMEGRSAFLSEYRLHGDGLHESLRSYVLNTEQFSRNDLLSAYDMAASCRSEFDALAAPFDAVLTPSVTGEAPLGLTATGSYVFNAMWSLLHVPCINLPGLTGPSGLPVGLTITGPRFSDRRLLAAAAAIAPLLAPIRP